MTQKFVRTAVLFVVTAALLAGVTVLGGCGSSCGGTAATPLPPAIGEFSIRMYGNDTSRVTFGIGVDDTNPPATSAWVMIQPPTGPAVRLDLSPTADPLQWTGDLTTYVPPTSLPLWTAEGHAKGANGLEAATNPQNFGSIPSP